MTEQYTQTLNEIIDSNTAEWTDATCLAIIEGLRELRERWNVEQLAGSRKLVRTRNVASPGSKINIAFKDLKL